MTTSHARALSGRSGALLGAIAVLLAGCAAAGEGSGTRAAQVATAGGPVAASPAGRVVAPSTTEAPGTGRVRHGSGPGIARGLSPVMCAAPAGDPVAYRAGAEPRSPTKVPMCLCCGWCACAGACCGCALGRWPPRSRLAWECCALWQQPPDWRTSPIPMDCGPGCSSPACPIGPQAPAPGPPRAAAGSVQDRPPGRLARPA